MASILSIRMSEVKSGHLKGPRSIISPCQPFASLFHSDMEESANIPSAPPSRKAWLFGWMMWSVSSALIPAGFGVLAVKADSQPPMFVMWGVPGAMLVIHTFASFVIGRRHLGWGILAFLGGFVLMAGSFFLGFAWHFRL